MSTAERIDELITEGQVYQAYCDGIVGNRLRVSIEWIDPISDEDLALARTLAERSRQRARDQR